MQQVESLQAALDEAQQQLREQKQKQEGKDNDLTLQLQEHLDSVRKANDRSAEKQEEMRQQVKLLCVMRPSA